MNQRLSVRIVTVALAVAFGGTAMAQNLPGGAKSGASAQSSGALVTLKIPAIVGVNVAHNFVLDFTPGTGCYGQNGASSFPQAAAGPTTYNFAVATLSTNPGTTNVICPGTGSQADLATVQVLSTDSVNQGKLQVQIADGGQGAQATTFSALIGNINKLSLSTTDGCGGGTVTSPHTMSVGPTSYVTGIPTTGWSDCKQTLKLTLASTDSVVSGTATGTLLFTMSAP